MRNDLHRLSNNVAAILDQQQNTETRQVEKDQRRELKELAAARARVFIIDALDSGENLASIYQERETIIELIKDDIKADVYYVEDLSTFKDKLKPVKRYNLDDNVLDGIIAAAFYSEFLKVERDYNKAYNLTKKQLEQDLLTLVVEIIDQRPADVLPQAVIMALELEHNKNDLIERIAKNDTEREILTRVYYPTLARATRTYPKPSKNNKGGHILPLSWRIIAGYKALGKIWRL